MNVLSAIALVALQIGTATPERPDDEGRAPMTGLEGPSLDACPSIGRIASFEARKGDFMRVRVDAYELAATKDKLPLSTLVWLCEADEDWQGIVYPMGDNQDLGDCRVSSALATPEPYSGPCQYGWIPAKHIELVAG